MRQLELNMYNKLKQDFSTEIEVLEKGLDVLVMYGEKIKEQSAYRDKTNKVDDLLKANSSDRCLNVQIMLINHSIMVVKASRILLLTGYQVSAMSCLRTAYESLQTAHICSVLDEQAIRFLMGKDINKKVKIPTPNHLKGEVARDLKRSLSNVGVHPNYKSLEIQAYFEGSIFHEENRNTYEFLFLRSLWSFFTIQLYLLGYLVEQWPRFIKEIPDVEQVANELITIIDKTLDGVLKRSID
jgi:hypothetical protein